MVSIATAVHAGSATAEPPDPDVEEEGSPGEQAGTKPLVTDGSIVLVAGSLPWGVDIEELRSRLAKELGAPIRDAAPDDRSPRGTLFLEADDTEVTARFEGSDGNITQRTIPLPKEPGRALDTITLVSGNVARDEAAELRALLARRRGTSPDMAPAPHGRSGRSTRPDDTTGPDESASRAPASPRPDSHRSPERSPDGSGPPEREAGRARRPLCSVAGDRATFFAGADLVPMLGTSLADHGALLHASLNVVAGLAGGIQGVQIGSAVNVVTGPVCGLQIGGAANITLGDANGVQIAGAVSTARTLRGVQIAGAMNLTRTARGVQIGGAVNLAQHLTGVQISGALNVARGLEGVQIGAIDTSLGDASGAQIGVVDFARDVRGFQLGVVDVARDVRGFQLGVVDVARDVRGLQLGVVNVARRVEGPQIGVVNVADDSDFSLGVVSIVRKGRSHVDVWGAETGLLMAAFKHGGRHFHNFYGAGIRPLDGETRVAFTVGLGGHFPLSSRFFLDVDGLVYSIHSTEDFSARPALLAQLRPMVGLRLTEGLALAAGPSYNISVADSADAATLSAIGSSLLHSGTGVFVRGWPGLSVGVQAF